MSNLDTINVGGVDFKIEDSTARSDSAVVVYKETDNTASQAYAIVGTPINWKGTLYYTSATIAAGDAFEVGVNLTATANLGRMVSNIKTYVGEDGLIHFVDATGADSALPFSGGAEFIKVGTLSGASSQTIDCTSVSDYQTLTTDDFWFKALSHSAYGWGKGSGGSGSASASIGLSYNASTGILTVTGCYIEGLGYGDGAVDGRGRSWVYGDVYVIR